jgi:chromosome segregation ATPase
LPVAAEGLAAGTPLDTPSAGGTSSSVSPPTPGSPEVTLRRPLRSGVEPEGMLTPLPQVLSRAHQVLRETEVAIQREWEALETEHQCLGDWSTQLEERTKAVSCHFASERAEFEQEREDFKEDIQKVSDREEEVIQKEKRLARKEIRLEQREEAVTTLHDKLKAYNTVLEKQRDK